MELKFEALLYADSKLCKFDDPTIPTINLGVLTDEEYWTIMDIAARNRYCVFTRPMDAESED